MNLQSSAPTWRNVVVLTVLLLFCQRTTTNGVLEEDLVASEPLVPSSRTHYNETESDTVLTIGVNPALRRKRRDIFHLYNMMTCTTGCDPLKYKGYGCYCGFLGSGVIMDGIDRCCKIHDYCYGAAECHQSLIYFVPYRWKCSRGHPYCVTGYGQSKGPNDLCAHQLCECDRQFAECISQYPCPEKKAKCASNPLRSLG